MPVIKRYSNRKLYDTESKRYVTLEDLADFIRKGDDVRVIDHDSGEDLTSMTLLQVIFEEEKKIGGLLPQVFMTRLIRAGGGTVNLLRSRLASIDPFMIVDDEIRRRIQALLEQGRVSADEAQRLQDLLLRKLPQDQAVNIPVQAAEAQEPGARAFELPPRPEEEPVEPAEIEALLRQVEILEQELSQLKMGSTTPAA